MSKTLVNAIANHITQTYGPCRLVPPEEAGLDTRCGDIFVGQDYVVSADPTPLEYYAGFDHHSGHVEDHPGYKIYFVGQPDEEDRVFAAITAAEKYLSICARII